jgi:hypothetical protein
MQSLNENQDEGEGRGGGELPSSLSSVQSLNEYQDEGGRRGGGDAVLLPLPSSPLTPSGAGGAPRAIDIPCRHRHRCQACSLSTTIKTRGGESGGVAVLLLPPPTTGRRTPARTIRSGRGQGNLRGTMRCTVRPPRPQHGNLFPGNTFPFPNIGFSVSTVLLGGGLLAREFF